MSNEKIEKGKQLITELTKILREISDKEVDELLNSKTREEILTSILDSSEATKFPSVVHFLLANKARASLLADIRHFITNHYSFYGEQGDYKGYCSPDRSQWFEDGIMFLSGEERFSGFIGLFQNNEIKYAIAARDIEPNEEVGKDHLIFLSIEEFNEKFKAIPPKQLSDLDEPIRELQELLDTENNDESKYQEWLQKYPWILGINYDLVERHKKLDDENIPDFTGRKVHDNTRDIIEIKPPFAKLFKKDGNFSNEFLTDWSQTKRYINFASENKGYLLREKGLIFENPKGYLIMGYNLSKEERRRLSIEERLTPTANIFTYNELLDYAAHTVNFVKQLMKVKSE